MKKLFLVVAVSIILIYLNQGYSYPILEETPEEIIMQNSWIAVKISKATGEITTLYYMSSPVAINLLAKPAYITIRDKKDNVVYPESAGSVAFIDTASYPPDSVRAVFDIDFSEPPDPAIRYSIRIIYTLGVQAFHWDAELHLGIPNAPDREANIDFTFPEIADMDYAFWTKDDAPFKLPMLRTIRYREVFQQVRSPLVIPCLILYDTIYNAGLSFISPFELNKPGLQFQLDTIPQEYVNSKLTVTNYYIRLGNNHPAHTALYIVPHEADWRPGFAWLYDKYPDYFNPKTALKGAGWHTFVDERPNDSILTDLKERGVTWVEFFHFPFYGLYAPPDKNRWIIINEEDKNLQMSYNAWKTDSAFTSFRHTDYDSNNTRLTRWRDSLDIQTYLYFQSFESWKQYAAEFFTNQYATDANGYPLPAWEQCYLMNPDPNINSDWGKHVDSQITVVLDSYPNIAGIFYDRDDYCDYDYAHSDSVTMIDITPVYMLGFAQETTNYSVLKAVHEAGKGVWTNGPTSVEVCRDIDGIMSENLAQAPFYQYLGINRPLILEPYDTTSQKTEEKLKTALWTGHFPSVSWYDSNTVRADSCHSIDKKYRPLFSFYKGKKWVLYPHALQLPEGIKGNIFRTPIPEEVAFPDTDYLVAMIDPERYTYILYPDSARDIFRYDRQAKVRVPDSMDIKYCYIQSGDYKGINQGSIYRENGLAINVPAHRVSSLIQLSKEPRYEITRTSSPVLTRGDSEKFEIKVHNITGEEKTYEIRFETPFRDTNFPSFNLQPERCTIIGTSFEVGTHHPLGEDTMKVIERIRNSTVVFTSWVVDLVTFQLPEKLFVHFIAGDTFPFILVNNTKRTLNLTLEGEFVADSGEINFPNLPSPNIVLDSLEAKDLLVFIKPDEEVDAVKILAIVRIENDTVDTVYAIRPVERSMDTIEALFHDDFSSRTMDKWDTIHGNWDVSSGVAKGDTDWHFARENSPIPGIWDNYKFQVNTKIDGSYNPLIDWLKSYIFFRVKNNTTYYRFGISGSADGYNTLNLYKRKGDSLTFLAKYEFNPKKNVWYNLSIEVIGDSIKCYLDGNQVISVRDSIAPFLYGDIGIGVLEDGMVTYYDDVVVRRLTE